MDVRVATQEAKCFRSMDRIEHARPARISRGMLSQAVERMRADPSTEFRTHAAAERHGVTSFVFIKAFKRLTGISPQRFHAALRIDLAKRLLVDSDRPVTEISLDVGYNSLGTFVRTFTELVGVSPTELRRLAGGDATKWIAPQAPFAGRNRTDQVLRGSVLDPPAEGLLAAGLFPQGVPSGLPFDGCFIDPSSGRFELSWTARRGHANLLVAAVSLGSNEDAWAGRFESIKVCSRRLSLSESIISPLEVFLRPIAPTDPPLLTPVPLLIMIQSVR